MAVQNLHEAAIVLQRAYKAIDKLLQDTREMELAYHERHYSRTYEDEELEALWAETGWGPYWDAAEDIITRLQDIDRLDRDEASRRFLAS